MAMQEEKDSRLSSSNYTMRIELGDACSAIICHDAELFASLQYLFRDFLSDKPTDVTIELDVTEQLGPAETEAAMAEARYIHEGGHFETTNRVVTGEYDLTGRTMRMRLEKNLLNPGLEFNVLNLGLSLAYYTACKVKHNGHPPALLVHTCSIVRHGEALLFAGPCESGKTTIARLCSDRYGQVVNDEMVLVSWPDGDTGRPVVRGVPIIGGFRHSLNCTVPLRGVLLIKQSKRTAVRDLGRTEAYLRFMRQIVAPAYIGQKDKRAVYFVMAEFADEITKVVPFYELEFTLDKKALWRTIGELEETLGKGGKHG